MSDQRPHNPPPPVPLALLLADGEYADGASGRTTLVGLFSAFYTAGVPLTVPRFLVFAELTEVRGPTLVTLRIVPSKDDAVALKAEALTVEAPDPLHVVRITAHMERVTFPEFGAYLVQLIAGDDLLMERWLTVQPLANLTARPPSVVGDAHA